MDWFDELLREASKLGSLPTLALVIVVVVVVAFVFYKQWLVPGPYHWAQGERLTKTETQRDEALEMAAKLTGILEAGRRGNYRGR